MARQYANDPLQLNLTAVYIAFAISLGMHIAALSAIPRLENVETKPAILIEAELSTPPPPPPPPEPEEVKPEEPEEVPIIEPKKPKTVKPPRLASPAPAPAPVEKQPPEKIRQGKALPVLASPETANTGDYSVTNASPENVNAARDAIGTAPEPNTGSIHGSPDGTVTGSIPDPPKKTKETLDDATLWQEYGFAIWQQAHKHKKYPTIAVHRGWEGEVKVMIHISEEGRLLGISVNQSSGHKRLDDQALEMVRRSYDDVPIPESIKGREFKLSIPVDFRLE